MAHGLLEQEQDIWCYDSNANNHMNGRKKTYSLNLIRNFKERYHLTISLKSKSNGDEMIKRMFSSLMSIMC
jgi:hypothetical protein